MNRKDFIKKTALGMVVTAFAQWDINSIDVNSAQNAAIICKELIQSQKNGITYELVVWMRANILKGDTFTFSIENQKGFREQATKKYTFSYELLSDFKRQQKMKIKNINNPSDFNDMGNRIGVSPDYYLGLDEVLIKKIEYSSPRYPNTKNTKLKDDEAQFYSNGKLGLTIGGKDTPIEDYEQIKCKEYMTFETSDIRYFMMVEMEGRLLKGEQFTISIENESKFNGQPEKKYTFRYELLEDFSRKQKISIKNIDNRNDFADMSDTIGFSPNDFFKFKYILIKDVRHHNGEVWTNHDEATIYLDSTTFSIGGKDTPSCFLTSACVKHKGLPDDCSELTSLRHFRDTYMNATEEGAALVKHYYHIAPEIVARIENQANQADWFAFIYDELVIPAIELIEQGKKELAMEYYAAFTLMLEKRLVA